MKGTIIDARWIGDAFDGDPDLDLPERPRLLPELLVLPFGLDGLLFVGAHGKQLLRGRSTRTLVPSLLAVLDGEHTLGQVVASFPNEPAHTVRNAVTLLYSRGLLEDGRPLPPPPHLRNVDSFLGRYNDTTRANRNRGVALERLQQSRVLVGGNAAAVTELVSILAATGVGTAAVAKGCVMSAEYDLVLAVMTPEQSDGVALLEAAHGAKLISLCAWIGRDFVLVGPLNLPGQSSCYSCLRAQGLPKREPAPDVLSFWVNMVALRAVHRLSRIGSSPSFASYQVVHLRPGGAASETLPLSRTPGCERCGLPGPAIDSASPAFQAWDLYNLTSKPPVALLGSKDYESHYDPRNVELAQREAAPCAGARRIQLPPPRGITGSPWQSATAAASVLQSVDLATLLARAAGLHPLEGPVRRRVAPTGGNLGSVELGLVVVQVEGVEPGIYRYHAPRHALERFPGPSTENLKRALGAREALPAAVIVGIGGLAKVYEKYGTFAYRVVHYDAGIAVAYLHRLSEALGLTAQEFAEFRDDALSELFFVDFDHAIHVPTFALGLRTKQTRALDGTQATMARVIEAARSSEHPDPRGVAAADFTLQAATAARMPLVSLDELLLRRRSVRSYTQEPIRGEVLRVLCGRGIEAVSRRIATGAPSSTAIRLVVAVADGGSDLPGGIYHVRPGKPDTLDPDRRGLTRDDLLSCLLQRAHAAAPVVIFAIGDLGAALADRGARGLREVMVQAGTAIGELWLAATAHGLGACASGGVIEVGVMDLARMDGYRSAPLLAIAIGYPQHNPTRAAPGARQS